MSQADEQRRPDLVTARHMLCPVPRGSASTTTRPATVGKRTTVVTGRCRHDNLALYKQADVYAAVFNSIDQAFGSSSIPSLPS